MLPDTFFAYIFNDSFFSAPDKDAYFDSIIDISIALKIYICVLKKDNMYDDSILCKEKII